VKFYTPTEMLKLLRNYEYRWSRYTGGPGIQVVQVYRWPGYTGGPDIQVAQVYRWSRYTGGPGIQVAQVYRWSRYTGGPVNWISESDLTNCFFKEMLDRKTTGMRVRGTYRTRTPRPPAVYPLH